MRRGALILAAGAAVLQVAMPSAAIGCTWEADATADMMLGTAGSVTSKHFGQITAVDCVFHSRNTVMRHKTLKNGFVERDENIVGGRAVLGASIGPVEFYDWECPANSWTATTEFGTRSLFLNFWHAQDLSNYFPNCDPGGGGCLVIPDTRTWLIGPTGEPRLAAEQLRFGLERVEKRPESTVYLEEWAVLSLDRGFPVVEQASTEAFGTRVLRSAHAFAASAGGSPTVLVVESTEHPHNTRHIPTPTLVPLDVRLGTEAGESQEFLFRAEVAGTGVVDDVNFLDASPLLPVERVGRALLANLQLEYADVRRHRTVVHGRGVITTDGRLVVDDGFVIVLTCCCDDPCCFDPEFGIWLCPCGNCIPQ